MIELLDVIQVEPQEDYTLCLVFENQQEKIFDMKPYLDKKPFKALKDSQLFMKTSIQYGTVIWPGNIDISPETLWDKSIIKSKPTAVSEPKTNYDSKT